MKTDCVGGADLLLERNRIKLLPSQSTVSTGISVLSKWQEKEQLPLLFSSVSLLSSGNMGYLISFY